MALLTIVLVIIRIVGLKKEESDALIKFLRELVEDSAYSGKSILETKNSGRLGCKQT